MAQTAGQKNDGSDRPASADVGDQVPKLRFRRMPRPGEPSPWFRAPTPENLNFSFDTVDGRRVVLFFFSDLPTTELRQLLGQMREAGPRLASVDGVFFGVSTLEDVQLRNACMHRIHDPLLPEIEWVFQFRASLIECYSVSCMWEAEGRWVQ